MIDAAALLPGESESYRLYGQDRFSNSVKSLAFGHLVKIAGSDGHYRCDLFNDALWLERNVTGPFKFLYGCDDCGTHIGTEREFIFPYRERIYECEIRAVYSEYSPQDATWFLDIARIK